MRCWRRMEKIRKYYRVKEEMNILHTIKRRKTNWIGHILRRNCLLKHLIEGKIEESAEVTGIQRRRHKQLLDDIKEKRGYWKLKEEALDRTLWRTLRKRQWIYRKRDCGMYGLTRSFCQKRRLSKLKMCSNDCQTSGAQRNCSLYHSIRSFDMVCSQDNLLLPGIACNWTGHIRNWDRILGSIGTALCIQLQNCVLRTRLRVSAVDICETEWAFSPRLSVYGNHTCKFSVWLRCTDVLFCGAPYTRSNPTSFSLPCFDGR